MAIDFSSLAITPILATYGISVTYTPSVGPPKTVTGVFDAVYQALTPAGDITVQSTQPKLFVKASDLSQFPQDPDTFTVNGVVYLVIESQPDGQGGLTVYLHKV